MNRAEFPSGNNIEIEGKGSKPLIVKDDSLGPEYQSVPEDPEKISKAAELVTTKLSEDLQNQSLKERVTHIPILFQEYGTDCGIACARMAMIHFGEEDPGTDGLFKKAKEAGLPFRMITDSQGQEGPFADPVHLESLLRREYLIERKIEYRSLDGKAAVMVRALKAGNPVQLSIFYHDLYPEDQSEMPRNHAILAKGYRFNEKGELVIVANDPKPEVGGEIEIGKNLLEKALAGPIYVYSKR